MSRTLIAFAAAALLFAGFAAGAQAESVAFIQTAAEDLPSGTPVRIDGVKFSESYPNVSVLIRSGDAECETPLQPDPLEPERTSWFRLPFSIAKDAEFTADVFFRSEPFAAPAPSFGCDATGPDLIVRYGERELLRYAIKERSSDDPSKDYLTRSGYFHPVTTLAGDVVTDDFSPDHPHQHGIFFAWTESRYGETKTEFWNQHLRRGTIRRAGVGASAGGPVLAGFETTQIYRLPETDEPILEETWQTRCFVIDADVWLLDLTVKQRALTDEPLAIPKYHYGGLGIRGERQCRPDVASFLTSEGKDRVAGNASRPVWTALSGPVGSRRPQLAVLDRPSNFRYPQPVRLHPDMPYFAISPMVAGEFEVSREKPFVGRYGIVIASEALPAERLDALQRAFAAEATVRFESDSQDARSPPGSP